MKSIVVVVLAVALAALASAGPAPEPAPEPAPAPASPPSSAVAASDQESQASEAVSKRGAARLSAVSGNSIVDNTVSSVSGPQLQLQQQPPLSYSLQQQLQPQQLQPQQLQPQQLQPQQQPQQPLYAPHPYSFVAPQYQYQYQPSALPALPPLLHSKYHAPSKHVLQYVPQPYYQVPQYQAPLMYLIPQPQPQVHQAQHHANGQPQQQSAAGQPEQPAQPQQQPHYVMVLPAPAANGFQYFNHPQLALHQQIPQQLITFYAGPQQQPQQQQTLQQAQHAAPQHQHLQQHLQQHQQQQQHLQQTRFYPEQQQLVFQSQPEAQNDAPHFVPKQQQQQQQSPVGLEAPAPPTPASLVGTYGARVQQPQHSYKTIIKA